MSDKPAIDRELEAFLAGEDTEVARIYRKLPQPEPDAALDAAVLAMARGAVEPQRRAAIRHARAQHRLPGWMIGIGTAAGFVFAAGLAWQLRGLINPTPGAAMRPASESADVINVTILPAAPPPPPPAAMPAPPEPAARAAQQAATAPLQAATDKDALADKLETPRVKPEVHGVTEYTLPGGSAGRRPQPAPFAGAKSEQDEGKLESIEVTGSRIGRTDLETAQPSLSLERESIDDAARKTNGKVGAPREEELVRRREQRALAKEKATSAPATAAAAEPKADARDRILPVNSAGLQRNAKLPPDKWLLKIRELVQQEKRDEALDNIDYFRAKYPSYTLPDDLQRLADEAQ